MRFTERTIGILAATGFDDSQVLRLERILRDRGAIVCVIGVGEGAGLAVYGKSGTLMKPDTVLEEVNTSGLDAVIIPERSSQDELISDDRVMTLVIGLDALDRPIGAIGNGQLVIAAAGLIDGRRVTGSESIRSKLEESGGKYVDQNLVVDNHIVTAREADELRHLVDVIAFLLEPAPSFS
jgi:protease I